MAIINVSISYDTDRETLQDALKPFLSCGTIDANDLKHKNAPMPIAENEVNAPEKTEESEPQPKAEPIPEPEAEPETVKAPSKTDIRAMATALSKKDKAKLKEIFAAFNATKLSDIPENEYPALMEKLVAANA